MLTILLYSLFTGLSALARSWWDFALYRFLSGLGIGMAATGGSVDGLPLPAYKTLGQNTFFSFVSGVASAGRCS